MSDGIKGYPSLYKEQIALRMVSGVTQLYKFGQNLDIDTGTPPEDVWGAGGVYTGFPASAVAMEIVSSDSEDDDAANGDGMRTCQVDYLESATSTKYTRELVSLDGTTPVALNGGNPIYRCNRVVGVTAGDTESNEGTITVRETATPANTSVVVPVGYGQSVVSQWTVPFENTLFITAMDLLVARQGGAAGSLSVLFQTRDESEDNGCWAVKRAFELSNGQGLQDNLTVPLVIPGGQDIRVRVTAATQNNMRISAGYGGFYLPDDKLRAMGGIPPTPLEV